MLRAGGTGPFGELPFANHPAEGSPIRQGQPWKNPAKTHVPSSHGERSFPGYFYLFFY